MPLTLFVLPGVNLRSFDQSKDVNELPQVAHSKPHEELQHSFRFSEAAHEQLYQSLNGPILTQFEIPEERGGAIGWVEQNVLDPILVPEVIHFHKVYVSGSIINAIERKNPLCLLNPLVLAIDW